MGLREPWLKEMLKPKPASATVALLLFSYGQSEAIASTRAIKSIDELPYSDNHLASHVLAYTSSCTETVESSGIKVGIFGHVFYMLQGDASARVFGHLNSAGCTVVCLEKGTPRAVIARPMPRRYWIDGAVDLDGDGSEIVKMDLNDFLSSDGCGQVEYGVVNSLDGQVHVYWVDAITNKKILGLTLDPGEDRFTYTYIGHQFEVYTDLPHENKLDNEMIAQFTIENSGVINFGIKPHGHLSKEDVDCKMKEAMDDEWQRQLRVTRTFSPLGFEKGRLPDDVFASLASYYYNNRNPPNIALEDWDLGQGIFVNFWETDVEFVYIPPGLADMWQSRLKDLVEEWVGMELETTDMYGMRVYTSGARLATHVDRVTTHAASLIVNIAQENVVKPWTVEIFDHANRLHEIKMEPGDIVYYESAKALHGRNTPLHGGKYINLFTHYRPMDDDLWYTRENPDGTPQPLLDVGECSLVGKSGQYSVGAVKCDNEAIGMLLSPVMFQATGGEDLYHWWQMTSPKEANVQDEL